MAHLSIRLLGPIEVTLDGQPVLGLRSDKARALLAYLSIEAQGPHRREKLGGLLWPDGPEKAARASLRRDLANLRQVIGDHLASPPFLRISRQAIQFNQASDSWVDVAALTHLLQAVGGGQQSLQRLEEALELYRGELLEGFSIADSAPFEEWALLTRERLRRLAMDGLRRLVKGYERQGDHERALQFAWRQVELDPWREKAQRQLMRLLALGGQRGAALAQYENCRGLLAEELGVEPDAETTRMYEQIRNGRLPVPAPAKPPATPPALPSFLSASEPGGCEAPVFVARERELSRLGRTLDLARSGQGRVVFVTGEAGSGKTSLAQEFTRRARDAHPDLVVASGTSNAYTGFGDPYLPFREVLSQLSGDVEGRWSAGAIQAEQARRLWNMLPLTVQALLEDGPDLIDTFIPGKALVTRAAAWAGSSGVAATDWLDPLQELVQRKASASGAPAPVQSDLFEQYSRLLQTLARQRPLLLWLDDLQWADSGSINLLFHLGRLLPGQRIIIMGAYRPEETALGRHGERHPLDTVVHGFQRQFGDVTVDLAQAEGRAFVEAFLDSEPNRLGSGFRDLLYRQTQGHPLYTIELLRGLQERGDLTQDADRRWVQGAHLDWETLPPRVEGAIAERIGRLPEALQETLRVASVEGEVFTAEVLAGALGSDARDLLHDLSGELSRRHRVVTASSLQRLVPGGSCLSRYRFRHILFQKYLYGSLDEVERVHLHEVIGNLLEGLYAERIAAGESLEFGAQFPAVSEGAGELALHFRAAGVFEKGAQYQLHAGIRAYLLSATEEAAAHLVQGLAMLDTLPHGSARDEQELALLTACLHVLEARRPFSDPEVMQMYARIQELGQRMDDPPLVLLNGVWWTLHGYHLYRAEYEQTIELGRRIMALAPRAQDPLFIASAHLALGWPEAAMGQLAAAREHFAYLIDFCTRQPERITWFIDRENLLTALSYDSWVLWCLGYPDQARRRSQEAEALAQDLGDTSHLGYGLGVGGAELCLLLRETRAAQDQVEGLMKLRSVKGNAFNKAIGQLYLGRLQAEAGETTQGLPRMLDALEAIRGTGALHGWSQLLACLVAACLRAGVAGKGLNAAGEALAFVEETGERYYEAELRRLQGELLLLQGQEAEAEECFRRGIEAARGQEARSWELRAATSLSRLLQSQGRGKEAWPVLSEVYGWFSEGFDTLDLQDARALLESLE